MTRRPGPGAEGEARRRKSLGKSGESVAVRYLENEGYRIYGTNYRLRGGEIDIIAFRDQTIVFCEVKTRLGEFDPAEGYSPAQQRRMVDTGEAYLLKYQVYLPKVYDLRYDVILVTDGKDGVLEVKEHIRDAFRPD
jgi:putative endonuclease